MDVQQVENLRPEVPVSYLSIPGSVTTVTAEVGTEVTVGVSDSL